MQAMDPTVYQTDDGMEFHLIDLPGVHMQVQVDSHSASPAFAEDNRQTAIALARAGAIDSEDLIHMLHPPGAELLLARLRERQKRQAESAQKQEQKDMALTVLTGKPQHSAHQGGGRGGKGR
jgi:recombinational DNA repair protein (RecF pathway)